MKKLNRRRFISALSLVGVSSVLRAQDAPTESPDYYYKCETRLLRGEIPGITGKVEASGLPDNIHHNGFIYIDPEEFIEPRAKLGSFISAKDQHARGSFTATRATFKTYEVTTSPPDPQEWGDDRFGHTHLGTLSMILTPYEKEDVSMFPLQMALRVKGKERMKVKARNQPTQGLHAKYQTIEADFSEGSDGSRDLNALMNVIEKTGKFEIRLLDSSGKTLAEFPFRVPQLTEARKWLKSTYAQQKQDMLGDKPRRIAKGSSSSAGRTGGAGLFSGCYLTTAAVGTIGLEDNCWELETFRGFRDNVLLNTESGKDLVQDYYELAPRLVEQINSLPNAERIWLKTYWFGVLPCALLVKMGANQLAETGYQRMTKRLQAIAENRGHDFRII